jgi:hypothetical protein
MYKSPPFASSSGEIGLCPFFRRVAEESRESVKSAHIHDGIREGKSQKKAWDNLYAKEIISGTSPYSLYITMVHKPS